MTTFTHMLRKDLREHRWLLLAWLAYLPLYEWTYLRMLRFGQEPEVVSWALALVFKLLGAAAVISAVVHADPTTGPRAAWRTRPVAWPELLAVKVSLLVALVVIAPAVTRMVGFKTLGFPLPNCLEAATLAGLFAMVLASMAGGLAVVTAGRTTYWAVIVTVLAVLPMLTWGRLGGMHFLVPKPATIAALAWPNVALFAAACVSVAGFQYRTGRTRIAIFALVALAAPALGFLAWTSRLHEAGLDAREATRPDLPVDVPRFPELKDVRPEIGEVTWEKSADGRPLLRISPLVAPTEPNVVALVVEMRAQVRRTNGTVQRFESGRQWSHLEQRYLGGVTRHEALSSALQLPGVRWVDRPDSGSLDLAKVGEDAQDANPGRRWGDRAVIMGGLSLRRYVREAHIPFARGASIRRAGAVYTVTRLETSGPQLRVSISLVKEQPVFDPPGWISVPGALLVVVNRVRREAFVLEDVDGFGTRTNSYFPGVAWSGTNLHRTIADLRCPDGSSPLEPAWLKNADLVIYRPEGRLSSGGGWMDDFLLPPPGG